jgi:two-component system sensor histidine kinase KdpD
MIHNLLDLSRIEGGALHPRLGWHHPAGLVAEAADRLTHHGVNHPVTAVVEPDLPQVRCDRLQIAQTLANLGDNAAKYTPPGTAITLSAHRLPDAVAFAVIDDGLGIPAEHLSHLFERFYRADQGGRVGGAGLGLAICKGLVEAHGGRIWAESREGEGTAIRFTLPLEPDGEGAA